MISNDYRTKPNAFSEECKLFLLNSEFILSPPSLRIQKPQTTNYGNATYVSPLRKFAERPGVRRPSLHLMLINRFQLPPRGRTGFFVAAALSAMALATADVPPAVAGGILPPGPTPGFQPGPQIIQPSRVEVRFSAGRDARL